MTTSPPTTDHAAETNAADDEGGSRLAARALAGAGGAASALAGAAAGHLVAALADPATSPVLVVGSTVIDATPTPVKEWAVAEFGTADKPILLGSVLLGTLVLAGLAGVLAVRRFPVGAALLVTLVAVPGVAALTRPEAGLLDALPSLVAALVGLAALRLLVPRPSSVPVSQSTAGPSPSRRTLLLVTAVAAVAAGTGQWITGLRTRPSDVTLPAATDPLRPLPTGLEATVKGVSPLQTPVADFYRVDTRLALPTIDVDSWELSIDGDVDQPFTLSFDELVSMPLVERDITLTCVSNEVGGKYVGAARWLGVPLATLLDRAGVQGSADQILSTDVDGFTISTPLSVALDGRDTLVAVGMNGEPLSRAHGFPARLVTPGLYGFVGATKWLRRLTLTTYDAEQAYWTERDWATEAPIKVSSRIDTPRPLSTVQAGDQVIAGVAWAQHRGIATVEVRIDGGPWRPAKLGPDVGDDSWRQWYLPWKAEPGRHDLAVRATSLDGDVQTAVRTMPFPAGSSGVQQVVVNVS